MWPVNFSTQMFAFIKLDVDVQNLDVVVVPTQGQLGEGQSKLSVHFVFHPFRLSCSPASSRTRSCGVCILLAVAESNDQRNV